MSKHPLVIERFVNGWASSIKEGPENSFSYSRHLDFRKDPRLLSVLPASTLESGLAVTGLITEMLRLPSGLVVAIDNSGGIYTRTTGGVWAKNVSTLPSTGYGMSYNEQQDTIYIPGTSTVHSITNADSRFGGVFTVNPSAITNLQDQSASVTTNSYTPLSSISEAAVDKLSITPTIEPGYSIKLYVATKGTGDLTVTMHDAANNVLATSILTNVNIVAGTYNEFVFPTPVRMLVKPNAATYHFHVTFSNGTASTIGTTTASDFSTAAFSEIAARLVNPTNGFHPVADFLQYIMIGNGRYVAAWEPISQFNPSSTEFAQHRLTFPSGYEVTSMATWNEYLAIAVEKRSSSSTSEFQDGKIFFWDGISVSYNFFINTPEGSPYGLFTYRNTLHYFAGGGWWAWNSSNPTKLFQMPNTDFEYTDSNTYMINYPNTMTVRNSILLGAFPSETNSTNIEHAVYSYGQRNRLYADGFGYSYSMSTGSRTNTGSNNLRIGMIKSLGDKLFISWRDDSQPAGSKFGVDKIDPNSDPFSTATWESLIQDNGRPDKTKQATTYTLNFAALPVGATVTPKYKLDRAATWTSGSTAVTGDTSVVININKRYREIQLAFDVTATTITPQLISLVLIWDDLKQEVD